MRFLPAFIACVMSVSLVGCVIPADDVIIFDDFCFTDIDVYSGLGLFELLDARDEVKSSIFISQHEVSGWYEKFKDVSIAEACLNRITHNAQRVIMNGRNMRG